MRLSNTDGIKPQKDMVLVSIVPKKYDDNELVLEEQRTEDAAKMYFGEVISLGPDVILPEHCPDLKVGDYVFFSEFAGHHVATSSEKFVKIIRGYDIMATLDNLNNIEESTIKPAANRLLVAAVYRDSTDDGLVLNAEEAQNPSLADLDYGIVLKKGPSCENEDIKEGMMVAYAPYVGECIQKQPKKDVAEYRVLVELDVLFTI